MASIMRDWLGPCIEEELQEAISFWGTSRGTNINNENRESSEALRQHSRTYSHDGSNLRIKLPADNSKTNAVQILKFHNFEDPIVATVSDSFSSITARFSSRAVQQFFNLKKKKLTEGTLGNLLYLRQFEIVGTQLGPNEDQVTLYITAFALVGSISQGPFGRPQRVEVRPTIKNLLAKLNLDSTATNDQARDRAKRVLNTVSHSLDSEPQHVIGGEETQIRAYASTSQVPFASQAPLQLPRSSPTDLPKNKGSSHEDSVLMDSISTNKDLPSNLLNDPKLSLHESLLHLLHRSKVASASLSNTENGGPRADIQNDEAQSTQISPKSAKESKNDNTSNVTESDTEKSPTAEQPAAQCFDTPAGNLGIRKAVPDRSLSVVESPPFPVNKPLGTLESSLAAIRGSNKRHQGIWHSFMLCGADISLPQDQEEIMERRDSFLQPGSRVPIANIPLALLEEFSMLVDQRAARKSAALTEAGVTLSAQPSSPHEVVKQHSPATVNREPTESDTSNCSTGLSSEESKNEILEDSDAPFSSSEWPTSPTRHVEDVLPPDTPRKDALQLASTLMRPELDESDSDLEVVPPLPLQSFQPSSVDLGGKRVIFGSPPTQSRPERLQPSPRIQQSPYSYLAMQSQREQVLSLPERKSPHGISSETLHSPNEAFNHKNPSTFRIPATFDANHSSMDLRKERESSIGQSPGRRLDALGDTAIDKEPFQVETDAASQHASSPASPAISQYATSVQLPENLSPSSSSSPIPCSRSKQSDPSSGGRITIVSKRKATIVTPCDLKSKRPKIENMYSTSQEVDLSQTPLNMARRERRSFMQRLKEQGRKQEPFQRANDVAFNSSPPSSTKQRDSISINSPSPESGSAVEIFRMFSITYPIYTADFVHFSGLCRMLVKLQHVEREPHRSLWDDFIIRHKTDYTPYIARCAEQGDDLVSYENFYRNKIAEPNYQRQIMTPATLQLVIGAEVTPLSVSEKDSTVDSELSSARKISTAYSDQMDVVQGSSNRVASPKHPLNQARVGRVFPALSPTGSQGNHIVLNETELDQPSPVLRLPGKVSAELPGLKGSSPLNPHSSLQRTPRILPWAKHAGTDESTVISTSSKTSETAMIGRDNILSTHSQAKQPSNALKNRPASQVDPPVLALISDDADLSSEETSDEEVEQKWWQDDNTPFKEFARAYGDLKILRGFLPGIGRESESVCKAREIDFSKWHL